MLVGDDRDAPAGQRQLDLGADQVRVPLVVRVDGDGGVAQHRLRAGGGDHDRVVTVAVADRDELAVVVVVVDLDVRQRRLAARAPVDDPLGAVDQALVEEVLEHRLDGLGEVLVHGEPLARPVDAVAEALHLAEDLAAVLGLPLPDALDELLAAQVVARKALAGQLALDDVLRRDARVVHARQPQHLVALHAPAAAHRVHQGVVERVAHVQRTGDVRRRQYDRERRLRRRGVGGEVPGRYPAVVHRCFLGGRVPGTRKVGGLLRSVSVTMDKSTNPSRRVTQGEGTPMAQPQQPQDPDDRRLETHPA